jgi:hypothetical protein
VRWKRRQRPNFKALVESLQRQIAEKEDRLRFLSSPQSIQALQAAMRAYSSRKDEQKRLETSLKVAELEAKRYFDMFRSREKNEVNKLREEIMKINCEASHLYHQANEANQILDRLHALKKRLGKVEPIYQAELSKKQSQTDRKELDRAARAAYNGKTHLAANGLS